ncbi:hypothetical protein L5515_017520 [Caenorhabditis briggsae]|uniref:Uncharacterized protein n=1 Tax=Caenorhabditis briggsae TaxID=6238 RepID=A0AAE9FEP6_CAEBR|nr:hypothetical protein L5515_017520 [Caenorhabditis briggsae]
MCSQRLVVILLAAFCTTASAVDSEGTNFVFGFVRNANDTSIANQVLTVSVLNQNAQDCQFTLTYRPDYHKYTPPQNMSVTVPKMGAIEVQIPSWYGWNYAITSVQDDVFLTLMGFSTCPVTLLANNYDISTGQGDTFMVLPTTWGSKSFTFSLPPAVLSGTYQYEQILVLPTTEGTTRVNVVEIGNGQSFYSFNVTYGNAPAVYIGTRTPDKRPRTYHVTSDKDVLIVAGVTCAGADITTCDHAAYMPHPPAASDCYAYDYYDDDHVSYLPTTTQFFTDIPGTCLVGQNITSILNDGVAKTITIKPQMESPLWTIQTTKPDQTGVAFHNGGSNIHIARYYDGTKYNSRGAFIATSPSMTQFHADSTSFYTRNANDSLEIYCTVLTCAKITIDTKRISIADTKVVQSVDGTSYYIFVITIANAGFHQIYLDPNTKGTYSFFVFGKNNQYSYGYVGGVNKPTFVLAPATSPGPTTTGPTTLTPPSTVTTQAPTSTATPPVTAPPSSSPVTSKQTSTPIPSQTSSTLVSTPAQTTASIPSLPTTVTKSPTLSTNTPSLMTSTVSQPAITSSKPAMTTMTTQHVSTSTLPLGSTATATLPAQTTMTNTPVASTTQPAAKSTVTQPVMTTKTTIPVVTTTQPPLVSSTVTQPAMTTKTTVVTEPVVTSTVTQPVMTTMTTMVTQPIVTTTVTQPVMSTMTTKPVITTTPPVVTTTSVTPAATSSTAAPTNPPVTTTQPAATSTPTVATVAPPASTSTQPVVTTVTVPVVTTQTVPNTPPPSSSAAPPTSTVATTTKNVPVVTTPTTAATTTTKAAATTPTTVVTTPTVPVTTPTTPTTTKPTPKVVTTPTTVTTQAPSTSTQSSSIVSTALPMVLTIFVALFL